MLLLWASPLGSALALTCVRVPELVVLAQLDGLTLTLAGPVVPDLASFTDFNVLAEAFAGVRVCDLGGLAFILAVAGASVNAPLVRSLT